MTQARILGGRYEIGELVGYGGMAEVHRGRDTRLNRDVAVKVLRSDLARDPSFLTRFRREAHSSAGLNHPSIVSVYDTGEDPSADGTPAPYIVMEYVEGRTLRDILKSEGKLPGRRAMEITADICSALEFSHRNGIVHRDIKPANVMITPTGAVKVMDFGIARAVADTSATVTQTANVIGTAQYLSPEQARGEAVDARSDVYSTGCLLYELVTGVPPFQGDSPVAVAYQHVRENPVMPSARSPEIPRAIDSIVMKALAKNQLNRYQSAGDMRADLQRALANQPVVAESVMTDAERTQFIARTPAAPIGLRRGYAEPVDDRGSRRMALVWAAIVAALLLVVGVASYVIFGPGSSDNGRPTSVAIPSSVIGQLPADAARELSKIGFRPVRGGNTSGPCDGVQGVKGRVCSLTPQAGSKRPKGSRVTYHLFTPPTVQVPPVEGEQFNAALTRLHALKLKVHRQNVNSTQPEGQVTKQTPAQYATVAPNSTVTLQVSTGKLKLPDVTGKDFDKAVHRLNAIGFTSVQTPAPTTVTHDLSRADTVADESPSSGLSYKPDTTITLVKYVYVQPEPTCTSGAPSSGSSTPGGTPTDSASSSDTTTLPSCDSSSSTSTSTSTSTSSSSSTSAPGH